MICYCVDEFPPKVENTIKITDANLAVNICNDFDQPYVLLLYFVNIMYKNMIRCN